MKRWGLLLWIFFGQPVLAQQDPSLSSPQVSARLWSQKIQVEESTPTERMYSWNILSTTTLPRTSPPDPSWTDYAHVDHPGLRQVSASADNSKNSSPIGPLMDADFRVDDRGQEVPAYWEAVTPATYVLEFSTPVLVHQIDLVPPLRKIGFSDFRVFVRLADRPSFAPVLIEEATTSRGPTLQAGYRWELRVRPEPITALRIEFRQGTLDFPGRVFLKDLDVWGE